MRNSVSWVVLTSVFTSFSWETATVSAQKKLVVEPGTPIRSIGQALQRVRDGQTVEVVSNERFRSEIAPPAKNLTLAARSGFHPTLANTLRIRGGRTIRIVGFQFQPYLRSKPAVVVEKMPDKLELVRCSFRSPGEVPLIEIKDSGGGRGQPVLSLESCFLAGHVVCHVHDKAPDLRVVNSCLVGREAVFSWSVDSAGESSSSGVFVNRSTVIGGAAFSVALRDKEEAAKKYPTFTFQLNQSLFYFAQGSRGVLFHWESFRQPRIPRDIARWSGAKNIFSGAGFWSMVRKENLSEPLANRTVIYQLPSQWLAIWANGVTQSGSKVIDFVGDPGTPVMELTPGDLGHATVGIGADIDEVGNFPN